MMPPGIKSPCAGCPFARKIEPGKLAMPGAKPQPPEVFVGQLAGPFWIPCHACYEGGVPVKEQSPLRVAQCAGAAIMRANEGLSDEMPPSTHRLPEDKEKVFATFAEFMAHHLRQPVPLVEKFLQFYPPAYWRNLELRKQEVKVHLLPKDS